MTHLEFENHFKVGARDLRGIVGPEWLVVQQSAGRDSIRKDHVDWAGLAVFRSPANSKYSVFQQPDEGAVKTQEIGSANGEALHELVEIADRSQFRRNVQQLLQFLGLSAGGSAEFGVGNGHGSKAGHRCEQRLFLGAEGALLPRIDQNSALGAGSTNGSGQQHSGGDQVAEGVGDGIDGHGDGSHRQRSRGKQVGGELQPLAVIASAHRSRQLRRFRRHGVQLHGRSLPQENANQPGVQ